MKRTCLYLIPVALATLASCVHTTPGTSVELALAQKAVPVGESRPTPAQSTPANPSLASVPDVKTELPTKDSVTEQVAEYFTTGNFCMQAGKHEEAIEAYKEVVKLDPTFTEAWNNLALTYEAAGQRDKALETFRKYKSISAR